MVEVKPAGLDDAEAAKRLIAQGPNRLPSRSVPGKLQVFGRQFFSPFIYLLLIAAIASFLMQQLASGVFILVVLLVNAVIGCIQEYSAQQAAAALQDMVRGCARVVRAGAQKSIDVEDIVFDDIVLLSSGDKVPADGVVLSSHELFLDESALSGESLAVGKSSVATQDDAPLTEDRGHWVFAGTLVTRGRAMVQVKKTGIDTQIGRIADEVLAPRESRPPLLVRIDRFTYQVATLILCAIVVLAVLMLVKGVYGPSAIFLMAVGLAVSVIPEGLPAALTVALAIGMRRMAASNVVIRRLVAVESLGSCTFICSDKTGTLTVNELTIQKIILPDNREFTVTGEGVGVGGTVEGGEQDPQVKQLAKAGVYANESQLSYAGDEWSSQGDIVDVAFLVLAKKLGLSISTLRAQPPIVLMPYESQSAFSASVFKTDRGMNYFLKGSPEKVLSMCQSMQLGERQVGLDEAVILDQVERYATQGLRLIALAMGPAFAKNSDNSPTLSLAPGGASEIAAPQKLVFIGMVGMIDPLRASARSAVADCLAGGIEVAMITGDHPTTARAIAQQLGLCQQQDPIVTGPMMHQYMQNSPDFNNVERAGRKRDSVLSCPAELRQRIMSARVFARIEPQQKELIVKIFMDMGHFVAVTGDGVNDAPAMRVAHTAVAMGKRGTDVARETADLIVTDDNFSSIVSGIREGRVVYNNIRKVIGLLVATGFSVILLFFLCVFSGLPLPMLAVQLLWLNLVANGLQDVALAFEPSEGHETQQPPRSPAEPIFNRAMIEHIIVSGSVMGIVAFGYMYYGVHMGSDDQTLRNLTLMLMVMFGNIHALNSRSEHQSILKMPLKRNIFLLLAVPIAQLIHVAAMYTPGIRDVLALSPISFLQWGQLLLGALSLLVVSEVHKMIIRRRNGRRRKIVKGSEPVVPQSLIKQ